jgi:hypothetical protein
VIGAHLVAITLLAILPAGQAGWGLTLPLGLAARRFARGDL